MANHNFKQDMREVLFAATIIVLLVYLIKLILVGDGHLPPGSFS
jgi:hypothetical protein